MRLSYQGTSSLIGAPGCPPYLPGEELKDAVNVSMFLGRPLLVKGEPGSGKTRLAQAIADDLRAQGVTVAYRFWPVKSTSRARDGLYTYDGIARLRDAQLAVSNQLTVAERARVANPGSYITWGPLGQTFRSRGVRTVLLIDEIDKADIDFPNDLLLELDEKRFTVDETGEEITADPLNPPIIIITSNDEKDLPDAFLRRCVFHYIEFPKTERLTAIVNAHFPASNPELVSKAVARFEQLRGEMINSAARSGKKVSTSELIDWFSVLANYGEDNILGKLDGKIPFPEVLLKSWDDHRRFLQVPNTAVGP